MPTKPIITAFAATSLLLIAACTPSEDSEDVVVQDDSNETLASLIAGAPNISTASAMLADAGLSSVLDGNAPYTVFAPVNAAFDGSTLPLTEEEARPVRAAIMRDHIVPGFLTAADIASAIESGAGSVELQTMGANTLTFTGTADDLTITSSDGSRAQFSGNALHGANGTVFPVSGVLKSLGEE